MSATQDEMLASIRELEALLPEADPATRALLQSQIEAMHQTLALLERTEPDREAMKRLRPALGPEVQAFFTPEPPAQVPAWLPDTLHRSALHEGMMRCPPGARVYALDDGLSCSIPGEPGVSRSVAHGLTVTFHATGRLRAQRFYERGMVRWSIEYHASSGAREKVSFYAATEPLSYPEHGLSTSYSAHGVVISQAWYHQGVHHGWHKIWEEDGFPVVATLYNNGQQIETVYPNGERRRA